jgi:hypothetical protein
LRTVVGGSGARTPRPLLPARWHGLSCTRTGQFASNNGEGDSHGSLTQGIQGVIRPGGRTDNGREWPTKRR